LEVLGEAHRLHGKRLAPSGHEPKNRLASIKEANTPPQVK
jgi:hypothetical protein